MERDIYSWIHLLYHCMYNFSVKVPFDTVDELAAQHNVKPMFARKGIVRSYLEVSVFV